MNTFELASTILVINGFDVIPASQTKEIKKVVRFLKKQLKELEMLKKTGGITVISESESIITTYHNDTMNRKPHKNKVIF